MSFPLRQLADAGMTNAIMPEVRVTILGAGAMGTAMGVVLSSNKYQVMFWDVDKAVVEGINNKRRNPRSLPHIMLDKTVRAEADITKAVWGAEMIVVALSSSAVRQAMSSIHDVLTRNCVIVSVVKGLESVGLKTTTEVLSETLPGVFSAQVMAFSGPTLARELAEKKPCAAMLASPKANGFVKRAREALATPWLHIYETRDVIGVQLAAVAKNALAVMFGIMDGLEFGSNARGWLLAEGFREMSRLIWKLGGQEDTVYGLAGFGDMLATALSEESRNRQFGELVGRGRTVSQSLSAVNQTVEGAGAIESLYQLSEREKLHLPILTALYEVVGNRKKADKVFGELMRVP